MALKFKKLEIVVINVNVFQKSVQIVDFYWFLKNTYDILNNDNFLKNDGSQQLNSSDLTRTTGRPCPGPLDFNPMQWEFSWGTHNPSFFSWFFNEDIKLSLEKIKWIYINEELL